MLKRLEIAGKLLLAVLAAGLLWRPGRKERARARLRAPKRLLLVRTDNRVGEALLTTPVIRAARALPSRPVVDVLVHPKVARVLRGHPDVDKVHTFDPAERKWGPFSRTVRALRGAGYDVVVNCANWQAPSVGPAIVSRLVGAHAAVIGPDLAPVRLLADVRVPALTNTRAEAVQRTHLLSPLGPVDALGARLSFRPVEEDEVVRRARDAVGPSSFAVVNPGGRLDVRRVPPEVFAAASGELLLRGIVPLVTWGPGEERLAEQVVASAPGAVQAPPTTIDQLAALMSRAVCVVCNNTGPMHLSVAVGAPTLAFFYRMELARWGHPYPPHRMLDLTSVEDPAGAARSAIDEHLRTLGVLTPGRTSP